MPNVPKFRLRSAHRRLTSLVAIASLLFSQLALASYVCPQEQVEAMTATMSAGEPCDGSDDAQQALCHQHGANASQSFEMAKAAAPSLPAVIHVLVIPPVPDSTSTVALPAGATAQERPPPGRLYLATLRLRV